MRPKLRTTLACTLLAALAALAGCGGGGSETIPDTQAQELQNTVENVRDTYSNDNCDDMQTYLADLDEQVDSLDVSSDIKDGLRELTERLGEQTSDCQQEETTTTSATTEPTTTEPTTTDTTDSDTTATTDTDTTDDTTTTDPTTTTTTGPTVDPTTPGNGPDGNGPPGQDDGTGGTSPRKTEKSKSKGHSNHGKDDDSERGDD